MKQAVRVLHAGLIAAALAGGVASAADRTERVTLGDGTTTLRGAIQGEDSVQYTFTVQPNQELSVRLATSNPSNYFNLERSGAAQALCQGAMTGNVCSVRSDTAADYVVDVFLMRNAARRAEKADYTLTISTGAVPSGQPAGASGETAAKEAAAAAVAACKSALALQSGANAVFVLPISHVPAAGGYEVFLSLKAVQWLGTTDPRGNVNRLTQR